MSIPTNFTLTPPNAAALAQYADLAGVTPAEFLNKLLEQMFERFADPQSGEAEPFLSSFTFKTRPQAERLAEWIRERDPELEIEVLPSEGGFRVGASYEFDGKTMQVI
jgi:hypothetical protein